MSKVLGYKIRHTKTNLYLSSISREKWTKVGKTWSRKGDVVRSINNGLRYLTKRNWDQEKANRIREDLLLWEVVELRESSTHSVLFFIDKIKP